MEERKSRPSSSERKSPLILLVSSDAGQSNFLATLLKRFEYQVYTASSAKDTLDAISTTLPSLIIISADLKDMDGLKLVKTLKKSQELRLVPFITLIKQGDVEQEKRCREHGAASSLSLPIAAEDLYRAVQSAVEETPRTSMRIRMLLPVKITGKHGDSERTCMLDISEHGIYLASDNPSPLHERLSLLINLNGRLIPVEAVVLHAHRKGEGPYLQGGMSLKFVRIDEKDREAIREFITSDIMRGIDPL